MVKISQEEIEFAYLCGLMHDIGIVVFDHLIPDEYMELLGTIKSSDITLAENEAETFGITHAELGARFIKKWWPVSPGLVKAIKHIAHLLANQNEFGNGIVPEAAAPLEYGVLDKLDIDSEELEILIENTKEGLDAAKSLLTTNG